MGSLGWNSHLVTLVRGKWSPGRLTSPVRGGLGLLCTVSQSLSLPGLSWTSCSACDSSAAWALSGVACPGSRRSSPKSARSIPFPPLGLRS